MTIETETNYFGTVRYYKDSKLHREDGPAVIYPDGRQMWYQHGKQHREDGPAVIYPDGDQHWFQNDQRHREDGPAMIYTDGTQSGINMANFTAKMALLLFWQLANNGGTDKDAATDPMALL